MIRVLFTGEAQFLGRHRLLLDAIEKRGFDVSPFDLRERSAAGRVRYAWTAARYVARAALLPGDRSVHERTNPHALKVLFDRSPEAFAYKSREFERALARSDERPHAIVHVFGLSSPSVARDDVPYAHYLDYTYALALRGRAMNMKPLSARERERFVAIERRSYERAGALFAMSRVVRDSLVDDYGIDPEKIAVVGAGSNIAIAAEIPKLHGSRRLLFNASEFDRKGGALVLAAFALLRAADPRVELVTVGAALPAAFAGRAGVNDRGRVAPGEMRELYATSDLVLAPAENDPFPGVAIEGMAHGTPAVVRDRDGMPEIVTHDRDGVVLGDADATPERLADIVRALLDDDARLRRLSAAARATTDERLNWDAVAEKMEPFFLRCAPEG